jgi:hypothetical protein
MNVEKYYLCRYCYACKPIRCFINGLCECGSRFCLIEIQNYTYKKGDRVQIIRQLEFEEPIPEYPQILLDDIDPSVDYGMIDYAGRKMTVKKVTLQGYIVFKEDHGDYYWSALWMKPLLDEIKLKDFLNGDLFEI